MTRAAKPNGPGIDRNETPKQRRQDRSQGSSDDASNSPPKKKASGRRKVNLACIYCRRSHMTCDENRPCQRCQPTRSTGRSRSTRKSSEAASTLSTGHLPEPSTSSLHATDSVKPNAHGSENPGLAHLKESISSHTPFSPNALSSSYLSSSAYSPSNRSQVSTQSPFASVQELSLLSPAKTHDVDPSMAIFPPMSSIPSNNTPSTSLQPLDGAYSRSMLAPSPLDVHTTPSRTEPSTSELHASQLGGTAWLGLGGGAGRASLVGDSGGGGEMTILSEFLESLDDGNSWYTCTDKPTSQTSDGTEFAFKPNMATMTPAQLQRTTPTTKMLTTPPSMASAGPESLDAGGFALAHHSSDMSILSPNKAELGRPVASTTTLPNIGETAQEDSSSGHDSHDMAAETEARRSMKYTSEPHREQQEDLHSLQTKDISSNEPYPPVLDQNASKTERFLLTAADQTDGSRDERLRKVIQAKYEAGLLRPYNHVNGYARLNRWMDQNVSASSRRRILKPLSVFRPVFVSIAKKLTQYDLIYIEEAFERLLLDYDRVFSIQSIPACLWRRTGEIYKGNKEFADLVGVPIESLREGRLCIYELMAEESAVNYWEKYGSVSFDPSQKAVLTMCKLFTKQAHLHKSHTGSQSTGAQQSATAPASEPGRNNRTSPSLELQSSPSEPESRHDVQANPTAPSISCCFSFTIRRDKWNVRVYATKL